MRSKTPSTLLLLLLLLQLLLWMLLLLLHWSRYVLSFIHRT